MSSASWVDVGHLATSAVLVFMAVPSAMTVGARAAVAPDAPLGEALARVSSRRVLFAHQSVGAGIVAGLERLSAGAGATLRIVELPGALAAGTFGHAFVGRNGEPLRKLAGFEQLLAEQAAHAPDIALLKFCYVDFHDGTDVAALFSAYQATFRDLERRYPHTTFVHVTVPLTTVQAGVKGAVKSLLGRAPSGFLENARREEFNALLRGAYRDRALFDLARLEATSPDGRTITSTWRGRTVLALDPSSTRDGTHPALETSVRIARALVAQLAALP